MRAKDDHTEMAQTPADSLSWIYSSFDCLYQGQ